MDNTIKTWFHQVDAAVASYHKIKKSDLPFKEFVGSYFDLNPSSHLVLATVRCKDERCRMGK